MTGNVNVPKITAPTMQVYQQPAQPYQRDSYTYTPRQFSAPPSGGTVMVDGPILMDSPVQGYQAPARTVDYSYKPQYTAGRTIESPTWAMPQTAARISIGGRFFPGFRRPITYGENGRMNLVSDTPSVE